MRPLNHLHAAGALYPGAWSRVDTLRAERGKSLPKWPAWCFLPLAGWYSIVSAEIGVSRLTPETVADVARLAAVGTWRYTKGAYRFDPTACAALSDTLLHGEMPVEVLLRLPEWCVYIETPGREWLDDTLHGFFAHLEWDANDGRRELRLLLDTERYGLVSQMLHLGPWTVTEAVDRAISEARERAREHGLTLDAADGAIEGLANSLQPLLALLLYLCSEEPEIEDREAPGARPQRPQPKRTRKHGWRLFEARKPRVWTVGAGIGAQLRRAESGEASGRRVSPHVRRAHWHGYWTGPRDGERKFIYKWLPPTVVAAAE